MTLGCMLGWSIASILYVIGGAVVARAVRDDFGETLTNEDMFIMTVGALIWPYLAIIMVKHWEELGD